MHKRVFTPTTPGIRPYDEGWLDLDRAASVEVTSEEREYGIDSALVSGETQGWRAASPGTQTIRLLFDQPQRLRRISLAFEENEIKRTQEFVLRWSPDSGRSTNSHPHPNSDDTGTMVHIAVHDADKPHPRRPSQYRQGAADRGFRQ